MNLQVCWTKSVKKPFAGIISGVPGQSQWYIRETPCKCQILKAESWFRGCHWHVFRSKINTKPVMNGTEKAKVDGGILGFLGVQKWCLKFTLPETNSSHLKWMVGRLLSFWETIFSGAMLVSGRVRAFLPVSDCPCFGHHEPTSNNQTGSTL